MSTAYAGTNTFPTTIPIPSDGDMKNAASVGAALQGLKDATIYLANLHTGTNPAGILKGPTIRGNATYTKDGSNRSHSFIDANIAIDDLSDFAINGPAGSSPTITISRNVNWPEGNHTYSGTSGQTVSFGCPTFFSQPMSLVAAGRLRLRRQLTATGNFDRTISAASTDVYIVEAGEITTGNKGLVQNGTADVSNTSFDVIRIISEDQSTPFPLYEQDGVTAIADPNTSSIVLRANPSAPGEYASVLLMWTGAYWRMIGQ